MKDDKKTSGKGENWFWMTCCYSKKMLSMAKYENFSKNEQLSVIKVFLTDFFLVDNTDLLVLHSRCSFTVIACTVSSQDQVLG